MIGRSEKHQEILDATELAFYGVDFQPVDPAAFFGDSSEVLSGSARTSCGYDPQAACGVDATEFYGLFQRGEIIYPDHRVSVRWHSGEGLEVDLETGWPIEHHMERYDQAAVQQYQKKVMQGLLSVMPDL